MKLSLYFAPLLAAAVLTGSLSPAHAQGWGTIKGQIVYPGDAPKREPLKVDKDLEHCLSKGPVLAEKWVVHPKNNGVRWVMVFLKPEGTQKLPIHPALRVPAAADVVVDQPCCAFEPHVLGLRADQFLVAKNSSPVMHNIVIAGFKNDKNLTLPAGKEERLQLESEKNAVKFACGIHMWMSAYCWVFEHPYFAVTDENGNFEIKNAPAGKWNLAVWHETGYSGGREGAKGMPIEIKPGGVTDLGKIDFKVNK